MKGKATKGSTLAFGDFGLQALEPCWLSWRQIEAARRTIMTHSRRQAKLWIRVFPDKPVTKKPAETRMGGGKGDPEDWVAVIKRGRILFELKGVDEETAREAFKMASYKLPIRTRFVKREED